MARKKLKHGPLQNNAGVYREFLQMWLIHAESLPLSKHNYDLSKLEGLLCQRPVIKHYFY